METALLEKSDLLVKNKMVMRSVFSFDSELMSLAAAFLYTRDGIEADGDCLRECQKLLKQKTSAFSEFRGNVKVPIVCKMALSGDADAYFERLQGVAKKLNAGKICPDEYNVLAAMTICDYVDEEHYDEMIERTKEIYLRMKKEHPFLTSSEDIPFAAMLAISDKNVDDLIVKMEEVYAQLKGKFFDSNAVQSLSHVLSLYDEGAEEKSAKFMELFELLKEVKHKFGTGYELSSLGALAMLNQPMSELVGYVVLVDDYLKTQKGFGVMSVGEKDRRLYAAQLVLSLMGGDESQMQSAVLSGMLTEIIAMEVTTLICISTCIAVNSN